MRFLSPHSADEGPHFNKLDKLRSQSPHGMASLHFHLTMDSIQTGEAVFGKKKRLHYPRFRAQDQGNIPTVNVSVGSKYNNSIGPGIEWDRNEHNVYVQNHSQPRVFHWTVKIFHGLFYLAGGSTKNSPWIKNRSVNFTAGQDRTWRTNILSIRNRIMFNFMATCLPHNHCTMSPPVAIDHCSWR